MPSKLFDSSWCCWKFEEGQIPTFEKVHSTIRTLKSLRVSLLLHEKQATVDFGRSSTDRGTLQTLAAWVAFDLSSPIPLHEQRYRGAARLFMLDNERLQLTFCVSSSGSRLCSGLEYAICDPAEIPGGGSVYTHCQMGTGPWRRRGPGLLHGFTHTPVPRSRFSKTWGQTQFYVNKTSLKFHRFEFGPSVRSIWELVG